MLHLCMGCGTSVEVKDPTKTMKKRLGTPTNSFSNLNILLVMEQILENIKNYRTETEVKYEIKCDGIHFCYEEDNYIFKPHCDKPAEFVCLFKDKGDSIQYGNGLKYVPPVFHTENAQAIIWRCVVCRIGFATTKNSRFDTNLFE